MINTKQNISISNFVNYYIISNINRNYNNHILITNLQKTLKNAIFVGIIVILAK